VILLTAAVLFVLTLALAGIAAWAAAQREPYDVLVVSYGAAALYVFGWLAHVLYATGI